MGRPLKQTADWFPHYVGGSRKTLFVLENRWGNDGYAFWFKLLELLCKSDGHFYDCSKRADMEYLAAVTRLTEEQVAEIIGVLVDREKLDRELWENGRIIWCQTLVDNLQSLYAKRTVSIPHKPVIGEFSPRKSDENGKNGENTGEQATEEPEDKPVKKPRRKRQSCLTAKQQELFNSFYAAYPKKVDPAAAERAWAKIEPEPDEAMTEKIIQAVEDAKKYDSRFRERQFTPNPASWLNAKGYLSEYTQPERGGEDYGGFRPSGGFKNS